MGTFGNQHYRKICLTLLLLMPLTRTANLREALKLDTQHQLRIPRDGLPPRYAASSREDPPPSRPTLARPENNLDPSDPIGPQQPIEKRCSRCDPLYPDYRYEPRNRYYDDYDRRGGHYNSRDRYYDYPEDRYNSRYDPYERYDSRDRYYERDRDRYYQDRRPYDYEDRDYRYYDRYNERGLGYDNRGYDYRTPTDRGGYRPWDQTTRGASGWDSAGRGYYFASGRPSIDEQGSYGGGYASRWSYGNSGSGRDDYYDRGGYYGRGREPAQDASRNGYGYGYLYGRPSTTTTDFPSNNNPTEGNRTSSNNS